MKGPRDLVIELYGKVPLLRRSYRPLRRWAARVQLKHRTRRARSKGLPLRIVLGANGKYEPGWIPSEVYSLDILDPADWGRYFEPASIDSLLAEHVWEHLRRERGLAAAANCWSYLRKGGRLRIAVPDGFFPHHDYVEFVRPGGTGPSAWDHKELYDHTTLAALFQRAGFRVELLEYYDAAGEFHKRPWSTEHGFVERSSQGNRGRRFDGLPYRSLVLDAIKEDIG